MNLSFIGLLIIIKLVQSIPRRGNEPWSVILCKWAEFPNYEPRTKEWVSNWMSGPDPSSIQNYFEQVSNGVYTIRNSNVVGWLQLPYTQKEILQLANADNGFALGSESGFNSVLLNGDEFNSTELNELEDNAHFQVLFLYAYTTAASKRRYFDKIKEVCIQTATEQGVQLHRQKITIVNSGSTAVYGKKFGVLLSPQLMFSSVLTHEMVHSFHIGHSYSDRNIRVFPYAALGEYADVFDLMSTANAYMHRTSFGMSGPGLNAAHLDVLGWLPMDRTLYFGKDGRQNYTLRLSSLSVPHNRTRGWLLVMIPYDRDDPRNFYTIELRTPHNFDRGILQPSILIHRVHRSGGSYYSELLSQGQDFHELTAEGTEWVKFLDADINGHFPVIRVSVKRMYASDADITTFSPTECRLGEKRWQTENETQRNDLNETIASEDLNYVCLEKDRQPNATDIEQQITRQNFYSSLTTYGANCCKAGWVWRAIDAYDFVCVDRQRRDVAQSEVDQQESRVRNGDCLSPYIKRDAFPGDTVCVTPVEKLLSIRETALSTSHLKHYEFFNGVDSVGP
ncbi:hypothetical protein M3Y95_00624200 [Aphelenchoides besseyi]|nr:hypothetical protein M3Y95_00624200 [Aphelenchoides besseyi]